MIRCINTSVNDESVTSRVLVSDFEASVILKQAFV